jgi:ADP-heptose:LPS heptosyltransferase
MSSRLPSRLLTAALLLARLGGVFGRRRPLAPQRILVLHHLLLGDTLMLTPLLAKLRARHPGAEIVLALPRAIVPLYASRPYGVTAAPFDPRDAATIWRIARARPGGFDLALVPGDNRWAWLARALGARWVVAHAGDRPGWKNWPVDEAIPYPDAPGAWGDLVAGLVEGPAPPAYRAADWPAPAARDFERPTGRYAVLHVGASSPLKFWPDACWLELAAWLQGQGVEPVWSGGPREDRLVARIDPTGRHRSYAGALDLAQMWALLAGASLMVVPDTGVAHLGRLVGVPTLTLFGPGSAVICGKGDFWRDSPYLAATVDPFPCRDQQVLFRRRIEWVRRCGRGTAECAQPRCMQALEPASVLAQVDGLLRATR